MSLIGGDDVAANARAERASNTDALGVAETPHPPLNAPPQPAGSLRTLCCPTIHPTLRQGHHAARSDHARRGWSYHARLVRGPALGGALLSSSLAILPVGVGAISLGWRSRFDP